MRGGIILEFENLSPASVSLEFKTGRVGRIVIRCSLLFAKLRSCVAEQ